MNETKFSEMKMPFIHIGTSGWHDDETLRKWIKKFGNWTENGIKEVYCYFDNDQKGFAAFNAK